MNRVLVVWSVHRNGGGASSSELHWLLCRLQPEVLFLEHSAIEVDVFLNGANPSLELAAAVRYREHAASELVPVGMHLSEPEKLKPLFDGLFYRIERSNPRYCQLVDERTRRLEHGGLAFLNSHIGTLLQSEVDKEIRRSVKALNESELTDIFERWSQLNDLRERVMIREIEHFAKRRNFNKAVFVVGAAHQLSLYEKVRQRCNSSPVAWEFNWQLPDEAPTSHSP